MQSVSAWALTTSDGIILIDALYDYSVEDEIVSGLTKLGLDPTKIKYVVITHGHGDHYAGSKYLQDKFGARIVLSDEPRKPRQHVCQDRGSQDARVRRPSSVRCRQRHHETLLTIVSECADAQAAWMAANCQKP